MLPLRGLVVWLAAIEYDTVSVPEPVGPSVTVTKDEPLTAVQLQPVGALTVTRPVVALAGTLLLVGEMLYVQATPSCVIAYVTPAIVSDAERGDVDGFAAMVYVTVPGPFPDPF
jgi:hypothetical protein